jgi:hypothetical protein
MREEESNRKFLCAVPIGRCWTRPSGEANERGREKRKGNKSSSLRLHISPGGRKARYDKKIQGCGTALIFRIKFQIQGFDDPKLKKYTAVKFF